MSLSSALFSGVSGLNTLGSSMSVIGDNIANVNTIGFKSARSTFETLLAQSITGAGGTSQVGRGVALSAVDASFSQGSFESTNEATDMAIGGSGFFMVRSPETGVFYTRAGHFQFDEEGYLVNPSGYRVQGWILEPDQSEPRGAITDIQINATSSSPNATEEVNIAVNLDTDSLFIENPGTIESSVETTSGFIFRDGVNDVLDWTDGSGGPYSVDLISGTYFEEDTVYTGEQVAQVVQSALNDVSTVEYTVDYNAEENVFTILHDDAANSIFDSGGLANETLGLSTAADTTIGTGETLTSAETAFNIISDENDSFRIAIDGGDFVSVALDGGVYSIVELRTELEDSINDALQDDGQSVTADVRYIDESNRSVFQITSSSRGATSSSVQLQALSESENNFLPSINMTDYDIHYGQESNGYSEPGYTESREENFSRFTFQTGNNDVINVTNDGAGNSGTVSLITDGGATSDELYSGDEAAAYIETALESLGGGDFDVSYDSNTNRFTITNNAAATNATIAWSDATSTAAATLGFNENDDIGAGGGSERSDDSIAFNIITGENDELEIIVNGTPGDTSEPSVTVTIDDGVYTGVSLARELEEEINVALAAAGKSDTVDVTFDEGNGRFRIASSDLGSDSTLQILNIDTTTLRDLVGGTLRIDDDTSNVGQGIRVDEPDDTSNYSTSLVLYDSLGNQHTVTYYFRKANVADDGSTTTWEWFAYVPASDTASGEAEFQARGTLTFNQQGLLTGQTGNWMTEQADGSTGVGFDFGSGAEPQQEVEIDFGLLSGTNLSTQFAAPSSTIYQTQDGFGSGFLQDVSVDADGVISGNYSNGQVLFLARVALADFTNPWGLSREGGNLFSETRSSGQPITGTAGSAGLGKIAPNSLEQSNVDLSQEFVNMIIQQRGFQANSRIITTTDDLLAEVLNLKR